MAGEPDGRDVLQDHEVYRRPGGCGIDAHGPHRGGDWRILTRSAGPSGGEGRQPAQVFLGLGSNLEERAGHLSHGLRGLERLGEILGVSGVYETPPEGNTQQPRFLNLVVHLETAIEPRALLGRTREIERDTGRVRSFRNAPRTLDVDILLYDQAVLDVEGLILPHPRMTRRIFVLAPLIEVAPALRDPRTGKPYAESLAELVPEGGLEDLGVRRIMEGEELLGREKR